MFEVGATPQRETYKPSKAKFPKYHHLLIRCVTFPSLLLIPITCLTVMLIIMHDVHCHYLIYCQTHLKQNLQFRMTSRKKINTSWFGIIGSNNYAIFVNVTSHGIYKINFSSERHYVVLEGKLTFSKTPYELQMPFYCRNNFPASKT